MFFNSWEWIEALPLTVRIILTVLAITFLIFIIVASIIDSIRSKNEE